MNGKIWWCAGSPATGAAVEVKYSHALHVWLDETSEFRRENGPLSRSLISFGNKTFESAIIAYRKHSLRAHAFDIINKKSKPQAAATNQRRNLHRARVTKWQLRCHKAPSADRNCDTVCYTPRISLWLSSSSLVRSALKWYLCDANRNFESVWCSLSLTQHRHINKAHSSLRLAHYIRCWFAEAYFNLIHIKWIISLEVEPNFVQSFVIYCVRTAIGTV